MNFPYRLCYVRTINDHSYPVQLVAVSDVSGDIATVSHTGKLILDFFYAECEFWGMITTFLLGKVSWS